MSEDYTPEDVQQVLECLESFSSKNMSDLYREETAKDAYRCIAALQSRISELERIKRPQYRCVCAFDEDTDRLISMCAFHASQTIPKAAVPWDALEEIHGQLAALSHSHSHLVNPKWLEALRTIYALKEATGGGE